MTGRHRYRRPFGRLIATGAVLGTLGVLLGVDVVSGAAGAAPSPAPVTAAPRPAQDTEPGDDRSSSDGSSSDDSPSDRSSSDGSSASQPPPEEPRPPRPSNADRAAAQARAQAEARRAAQRAAERAAERAEAAAKVRATWESRDRPHRMVVVRQNRIEVVTDGRLSRRVTRSGGPVTIAALDRALPGPWLEITDGNAVLGAAIVLTPGPVLEVGGPVRRLALLGGPSPQDASSIYTGGGRVALNGVTLTSTDPATGQTVHPTAAGRPFIVVSARGRLDAVDATISDLGTPSTGIDGGRAGVVFNPGSSGSLVRTTLKRNTTGAELSRSDAVRLEQVTFSDSVGDGLVLSGDRGTTMSGVRVVGNGGYGVVVIGQTGTRLSGIATATDRAGGLRINRSTDLHVSDFSATDQPTGVFMHVNSARIVLDHLHTTGGRRGVVAEKSTAALELRDSSIGGARVAGIAIGGKDILLHDVQVSDSRTGVRVERGAAGVRLAGLVLNGGRDGVVATAGTAGVVIADLVANHVESDAVRTASPAAEIIGGSITGGTTGIDVAASTAISGITITGAEEGIHSRSPEPVRADDVTIDVTDLGINAAPGSPFQLAGSSVHALEALRGEVAQHGVNDLSLPPLNLLSAIGVPLILLAIVLDQVHASRQRRVGVRGRRQPPALVGAAG